MSNDDDDDGGVGHNRLLEIAQRALEGIREYQAGVAKEQAGRECGGSGTSSMTWACSWSSIRR
jgi:hypothetical protein